MCGLRYILTLRGGSAGWMMVKLAQVSNLAIFLLGAASALPAEAQSQLPADLGRLERQLEQVRRDTRLTVDTEAPVGQRTLLQYGAYLSVNYLSLDDSNHNNHTLWQPELVLYGRLDLDRNLFRQNRAFTALGVGIFTYIGSDFFPSTSRRSLLIEQVSLPPISYMEDVLYFPVPQSGLNGVPLRLLFKVSGLDDPIQVVFEAPRTLGIFEKDKGREDR